MPVSQRAACWDHLSNLCSSMTVFLPEHQRAQSPDDQRPQRDLRKSKSSVHSPIFNNGTEVKCVTSITFLGVHISEDLSCHSNTLFLIRNPQHCLYFLKAHMSSLILISFYKEHPDQLHHSVVWRLHREWEESTAKCGENCPVHNCHPSTCHWASSPQ